MQIVLVWYENLGGKSMKTFREWNISLGLFVTFTFIWRNVKV